MISKKEMWVSIAELYSLKMMGKKSLLHILMLILFKDLFSLKYVSWIEIIPIN